VLFGRTVVGELGQRPLRLALRAELALAHERRERVLLDVHGLLLPRDLVVKKEHIAVRHAESAQRLAVIRRLEPSALARDRPALLRAVERLRERRTMGAFERAASGDWRAHARHARQPLWPRARCACVGTGCEKPCLLLERHVKLAGDDGTHIGERRARLALQPLRPILRADAEEHHGAGPNAEERVEHPCHDPRGKLPR